MARPFWILWQSGDTVTPLRVTSRELTTLPAIEREISATDEAATLAHALREHGYRNESVVFAIGSENCLAATLPYDRQVYGRDRQSLTFAFEEHLPVPIEDLVVDFQVADGGATCLGIGVKIELYQELLTQLEDQGVGVHHLVPAPVVATQYLLDEAELRREGLYILWTHVCGFDLLRCSGGKPSSWRSFSDLESLRLELAFDRISGAPRRLITGGLASRPADEPAEGTELVTFIAHQIAALTEPLDIVVEHHSITMAAAVAQGGVRILSAKQLPWIELRRDALRAAGLSRQLATRLRLLTVSVVVLVIGCTAALEIWGHRLRAHASAVAAEQAVLFQQIMPGQRVPIGVRAMLEAERNKLAGAAGQHGNLPVVQSTLIGLHDVLTSLPADIRLRILGIHIDAQQIEVEGQARQHSDAEQIAANLTHAGWQVAAPRTEALPDAGVSWTLAATMKHEAKPKP